MNENIITSDQLAETFDLGNRDCYTDLTFFQRGIGFSVQRTYPDSSRFKPPVTTEGKPDTVALIGVIYEPEERPPDRPHLVPVRAKISAYSRYTSSHWDYNFADPNCPTRESVEASKRTPRPVDLATSDAYYYDHARNGIVDSQGRAVDALRIIDDLYDHHLATVDKFKGTVFRLKLKSIAKASDLCEPIADFCVWLLRIMCGRTLEPKDVGKMIFGQYAAEDMKLLQTESIDVFGYKASKNVIGTYCALLVLIYAYYQLQGDIPHWISAIGKNNIMSLAVSILAIAVLDHGLPPLLLRTINFMKEARWGIRSINVQFK